ncbi:helix-turn-helix domain-containing protein [Listeria monocytogenes]|nr:helix-turn-helix domain-containing protein [Listeria monocytogenes]MDA6038361.1 helix-turn-helix domain-containing protein [Listeria monocytogenes]
MEFLTTTEMAEKWEISRRRVTTFCKEGRIVGAVLKGNTWLIPKDTIKPVDPRIVKKMEKNED